MTEEQLIEEIRKIDSALEFYEKEISRMSRRVAEKRATRKAFQVLLDGIYRDDY